MWQATNSSLYLRAVSTSDYASLFTVPNLWAIETPTLHIFLKLIINTIVGKKRLFLGGKKKSQIF